MAWSPFLAFTSSWLLFSIFSSLAFCKLVFYECFSIFFIVQSFISGYLEVFFCFYRSLGYSGTLWAAGIDFIIMSLSFCVIPLSVWGVFVAGVYHMHLGITTTWGPNRAGDGYINIESRYLKWSTWTECVDKFYWSAKLSGGHLRTTGSGLRGGREWGNFGVSRLSTFTGLFDVEEHGS